MAIIIDMTTGEVLEEKAAYREASRPRDTGIHRPEMPQTDLQTYEQDIQQRSNAMPEELVNADIDAFLKDIEKSIARE